MAELFTMLPPNKWSVRKLADVGTDEVFVRETAELFDLLKGTMIEGEQREQAAGAIGSILHDGLIPTFMELRAIRESRGKDLPLIEHFQLYEDFARKLWKAYKDLTQRAAAAMGFDIGFLFQKESKFEEGLKTFRTSYPGAPANLEKYLREVRTLWQNDLAQFRNGFLEHQEGSRQDHMKFYDPDFAENLFAAAARIIADILVMLMNLRLLPGVHIVEHDDKIHGAGWPNRFRWVIEGFAEIVPVAQKPSEQP
jgi:hypothetical protein